MRSAGGADAVQRRSHQADERNPERDESSEALRLGAVLQGEGPSYSAKGAECAAQVWLPQCPVSHGLDERPLPGGSEDIMLYIGMKTEYIGTL